MAEFLGGIEFVEYVGNVGIGASPSESFTADSSASVRVLDVKWVDRQRTVIRLLGHPEVKGTGSQKYLSRILPDAHPDWLKLSDAERALFCTKVEVRGYAVDRARPEGEKRMKSTKDTVVYEKARLTAQYSVLHYDILSDEDMIAKGYKDANGNPDESTWKRFCYPIWKPKVQALTLDNGVTYFASSTTAIPNPPLKIIPGYDLEVTWYQVPADAVPSILVNPVLQASDTLGAIDTSAGKVNLTALNGFAAGTLLMLPPDIEPHRGPRGDRLYNIVYHFEFFPLFHNRVPRVNGGTQKLEWVTAVMGPSLSADDPPVSSTAGKYIYDAAEFRDLFRVPT